MARSLVFACFALLLAFAAAQSNRRNLPNCDEYVQGKSTPDAVVLPQLNSRPYEQRVIVNNEDNCLLQGKRLVGALIKACDPFGPPPPTINAINIQEQVITCHSDGPCPAGLEINISQYCSP